MPGYSTRRGSARPHSKAGKKQQTPTESGDNSGAKRKPQQSKVRCSPASSPAAVGAKRKRSEEGASEFERSELADNNVPRTTGVDRVVRPSSGAARSDQQKAKKLPARSPAKSSVKSRRNSKRARSRLNSLDSEYDPEDEVPIYTLAQKQKPAAPLDRQSNSREQANRLSAASRQRNAAAAASAAASFGNTKSGRRTVSESAPSSRGLTGLVLMLSNPPRQCGPDLPPKHPGSHYGFYRNLSHHACHNEQVQLRNQQVQLRKQQVQLSLAEAPFRDAAKSGVASFAYFEPGFMTFPFSVSAFAAESKAAMSRLADFVAAAHHPQDPAHDIEASSLRVAPLEERQQAAIQAALSKLEGGEADGPPQQPPRKQYAGPRHPSGAALTGARMSQAPLVDSNAHPSSKSSGLTSLVSGLMPPPPPRAASKAVHAGAMASVAAASSQGAASLGLSPAPLLSAPDLSLAEAFERPRLPQVALQLHQRDAMRPEHMLVDAPSLQPLAGLASAPGMAAPALPNPPGLPSETAAVAAASDALIATFSGTGAQPKAPATAAAGDADGNSNGAPAANGSGMPQMREDSQTRAAPSSTAASGQSDDQPQPGSAAAGHVGTGSGAQSAAEADVARQAGNEKQPGREAATAGPGRPQSPLAPPLSNDFGDRGRAALAAMPKIGPDSDDKDVSCINTRYRPRTAVPVKMQTKEQLELQQKMVQAVRNKWLEGLHDAAKELTSLSVAQEIKTGAARKRWDRNVAVEGSHRLGHAEAFAQRAHQAPLGGRHSSQAELCSGPFLSTPTSQSQSLGIPPLPQDTVLTFTVHRFDRPGKILATVSVLGRQKLTVLRDTIKCEADANLTQNNVSRASACLYFEGVFFNDMRDKRAVDMSYHIRDFCQKQAITVPPPAPSEPPAYPPGFSKPAQDDKIGQCQPRAQKMEETTFDDLFLRVGQGAGYVYMHQGCCEHLVELSDVRSIHHAELLQSQPTLYPLVLKEAIRHRRDCKICKMANIDRRADWVTHNDRNAPTNPAFWCEDCYRQMHYDAEGNACYQDYSAFSYMYEYGNLKQKQSADQSAAAESAPDETEGL